MGRIIYAGLFFVDYTCKHKLNPAILYAQFIYTLKIDVLVQETFNTCGWQRKAIENVPNYK